jgi:hypothetical protein
MSVGLSGETRKYYSGEMLADSGVFVVDATALRLVVEARAAMIDNKERAGRSENYWGVAWNCNAAGDYDYCRVACRNLDYYQLTDKRVLDVEVGRMRNGTAETIRTFQVDKGVNLYSGFNTLTLEWSRGKLNIFVGTRMIELVGSVECNLPDTEVCRLISKGEMEVASLVVETEENRRAKLLTDYTEESVCSLMRRSIGHPTVGEWHYLDRETDDNRARLGGKYILYVVPSAGRYLILYGGGAVVNAEAWEPMMIKGELKPTRFESHYDLVWYDSMMEPMDDECYATVDDEGVLTLQFPLSRSRMRFYRK